MGQSIDIGVATEIFVKKENMYHSYTLKEIKQALSKTLNLDLYDITENKNSVCLSIKPKVFSENIISLLQKEYEVLGIDINNKDFKELFEIIKNTPSNELLNKIENKDLDSYCFQFTEGCYYISNDISYIAHDIKTGICADMVSFYSSEKAFLEAYNSLFDYLRTKIIETMDNPLKDDVFITLFG